VTQDVAKLKRFAKMEASRIVKCAARNAGLKEWKDVYPHSLRKSFEEALRRRRPDGSMMNEKEVKFLFGHLLAGSQDTYFGSGVRVEGSTVSFDKAMAKIVQFFPERSLVSRDETLAIFNRRFLKMSNWTDGEIDMLGDLSELEEGKMRELLDRKSMQEARAQREHAGGRAHGRGEEVHRGGPGSTYRRSIGRGRDQAAAPLTGSPVPASRTGAVRLAVEDPPVHHDLDPELLVRQVVGLGQDEVPQGARGEHPCPC